MIEALIRIILFACVWFLVSADIEAQRIEKEMDRIGMPRPPASERWFTRSVIVLCSAQFVFLIVREFM